MTLVAIDIGSHKICTLVGEAVEGGKVRVLGLGHAPSEGIRAGEVVHVEDAAGAIAASVERAERACGVSVHHARVGVSGLHLSGTTNRGLVPCGRRPRPVAQADVDRVLEVAGSIPLSSDREVMHVLAQHFAVDGGTPVDSPVSMEAYRVEAAVYIVTASTAALANLRRCLRLAAVTPVGLTASAVAAAEAVLTPDERQLGVMVVDLGAATTSMACYVDNALVHLCPLPGGGRQMTNALGLSLQTPLAEAEHIKIGHGHVLPELDTDEREIEVTPFGDEPRRTTTRLRVSEVLAAHADETAERVWAELDDAGLHDRLPAGAVLVGGGTELQGLPQRLAARWGMPVRVGRPRGVVGLADAVRGPAHASAVGLLLWDARGIADAALMPAEREGDAKGIARLIDWARRAFLPTRNGRAWERGAG